MASPFRSYESFFQDLEGTRERTDTRQRAPTFSPGSVPQMEAPQTPRSPSTPTFDAFGRQERPSAFQGFAPSAPQPQPQPQRPVAQAVGGQTARGAVQQQPRSPYTSNFGPSAAPTPAPPTGGPLTYQPTPETGGPLTYQPPAPQTGGPLTYEAPQTGGPLTYEAPAAVPAEAPPAAPEPPPIYGLPEPRQLAGYEAPEATRDYYSQLVAPILGNLQEGYGQLGGAVEDFYGQLPDIQSWEALGGPGLLQAALGPASAERLAAEEQLREILGAAYEGPGGLQGIDDLYDIQTQLDPWGGRNLSSMAGTGALLQDLTPGLTAGMRREEARRLLDDEGYMDYVRQLGRDVGRLRGVTGRETQAAEEAARGQREAAEGLRGAASGALESERGKIEADIAGRLEEARAQREAFERAYEEYGRTGDISLLEEHGIPAGTFSSELGSLDAEARQVKEGILNDQRFASIKDVPLMQLGISSHGRERLDFPQEWYDANREKYTKAEMAELKKLARERQKALDEAGFARPTYASEGGKYAGVENLYFGGDVFSAPEDLSQYISMDVGNVATRHSLATEAQRDDFNKINDILGVVDRLEETDPYQAAQLLTDTEAYINDLEAQYEEAFGELKETATAFDKLRKKIRKKYRESSSTVGKITGELTDIFGSDLGNFFSGIAHKTPIPGIERGG